VPLQRGTRRNFLGGKLKYEQRLARLDTGPRLMRRPQQLLSCFLFSLMLAIIASLGMSKSTFAALPPAGATIGNQASATYTDFEGNNRTATSNTVITTVQQVGGLDLQAPRTKQAAPGGNVYFPHTVTNTGNGPDSYNLNAGSPSGDFSLTNLLIYADENGDGVPDNFTPITVTPELAAGATYSFVVAAVVPSSAAAGDQGQVTITATSTDVSLYESAGDATKTNIDTAVVSNNAIIDVTKSIDVNKGSSNPASTHRYTLTYVNNGIGAARELRIEDTLNADLVYQTGSGQWSQKAGVLSEQAFGATAQAGNGAATILYNITGQVVTAIISNVAPGETGTISFDVKVKADAPPQVIPNNAVYQYINNDTAPTANITGQVTNTVNLTIDPTAGVSGTSTPQNPDPDDPTSHEPVPQGSTLYFINNFVNEGTGVDTFDVVVDDASSTYPAGTSWPDDVNYRSTHNRKYGKYPVALRRRSAARPNWDSCIYRQG